MICKRSFRKEFDGCLFYVKYSCKEIIIKKKGSKKPIILKRVKNDCYICVGRYINPGGYVKFRFNYMWIGLHRFSYCFFNGVPIEKMKGFVVRHKCDNRKCSNPLHLIKGTHEENMSDMVERERQARGEKLPASVLNEHDVEYILSSEMSCKYLADVFNVHVNTIRRIKNRETWKHVEIKNEEIYI